MEVHVNVVCVAYTHIYILFLQHTLLDKNVIICYFLEVHVNVVCVAYTHIYTIFTIHISTPKYYHCSPQVKKRWLMQSKIKYSFQVEKNFIGNLHTKHSQCYYVLLTSLTPKRMYGIMHVRHSILRTILLKIFWFALSLLSCFSSSTLHPRRCLLACNLTS